MGRTGTARRAGARLAAGVLLGYATVSLAESYLHANVQHASVPARRRAMEVPLLGAWIKQAHLSHSVVHHRMTFRRDHVTQFEDFAQRDDVADWTLRRTNKSRIVRDDFGLSVAADGVLSFLAPVAPIFLVYSLVASRWMRIGLMAPLVIYPLSSRVLHPYLHMSDEEVGRRSTAAMRWLLHTRCCRYIAVYHYVHHKDETANFNLLLFGDIVTGHFRRPTEDDRNELRSMGVAV